MPYIQCSIGRPVRTTLLSAVYIRSSSVLSVRVCCQCSSNGVSCVVPIRSVLVFFVATWWCFCSISDATYTLVCQHLVFSRDVTFFCVFGGGNGRCVCTSGRPRTRVIFFVLGPFLSLLVLLSALLLVSLLC